MLEITVDESVTYIPFCFGELYELWELTFHKVNFRFVYTSLTKGLGNIVYIALGFVSLSTYNLNRVVNELGRLCYIVSCH